MRDGVRDHKAAEHDREHGRIDEERDVGLGIRHNLLLLVGQQQRDTSRMTTPSSP